MVKFEARGKFVILTQNEQRKQSTGGIIFAPDTSMGDTKTGHIIAIGPDVKNLEVGQDVIALWSKGTSVTFDGVIYAILEEEFVAAVVGE